MTDLELQVIAWTDVLKVPVGEVTLNPSAEAVISEPLGTGRRGMVERTCRNCTGAR